VFTSYAAALNASKKAPVLHLSIQNLPPRHRNAFQRLWQQLSLASGISNPNVIQNSKDSMFILPDIDLRQVGFYPFHYEDSRKLRHQALGMSSDELFLQNFTAFPLPVSKDEISDALGKLAREVVENHLSGRGLQYTADPHERWDFQVTTEERNEYISLALSAPLDSICTMPSEKLREAWRMHQTGRGEEVVWYCLRWRSMSEIDFVLINNPLKQMLEGKLNFTAGISIPV
jgi:hypothetical protein